MKRFILFQILYLICIQNLIAATFYVDIKVGSDINPGTINNPWKNLDFAINQLNQGDTLFIRSGNYTEFGQIQFQKNGSFSKPVIIAGFEDEYPQVEGFLIAFSGYIEIQNINFVGHQVLPANWLDMPEIVIDNPNVNTNANLEWLAPDYRIDSVLTKYETYSKFFNYEWNDIPTWESNKSIGLAVIESQNITIKNNWFSMHTYGIRLNNESRFISIDSNEFKYCLDAISAFCDAENYLYSFSNSQIINNTITQSFRNGIMLNYGANNNVVENNIVTYSGQNHISTYNLDIQSDSAGFNLIKNNVVAYGGYYGDFMKYPGPSAISLHSPGPGSAAINNYIAYHFSNAKRNVNLVDGNCLISDNNPHGSEFINNICYRPTGNGVSIVNSMNNLIIHNTIIEAGFEDPVSLNNGVSIKIVDQDDNNNIIYNNILANSARASIYAQFGNLNNQTEIANNLYYQPNYEPIAVNGDVFYYSIDQLNSIGIGVDAINSNPLFVDTLGNISTKSPAIAAGGSLYTTQFDYDGAVRNSSKPTIGAWEHGVSTNIGDVDSIINSYRLYPNPIQDILIIESDYKKYTNPSNLFKLYDINGKLLILEKLNKSDLNFIRLPALSSGIYIYEIGNFKGKLIKK